MGRHTGDIDVLDISAGPATASVRARLLALGGVGSPLHHKFGVYLEQVGIAPLPYRYEERLRKSLLAATAPDSYGGGSI